MSGTSYLGREPIFIIIFGLIMCLFEFTGYIIFRPIIVNILDTVAPHSPAGFLSQTFSFFTILGLNFDSAFIILFVGTLMVFVFLPASKLF